MIADDVIGLREELVGHSTVVVLSILGLAFYSLSYSLIYASASSVPVVAVLEMWMVSSHLGIGSLSLALQSIGVKYLKINAPLPFVSAIQTSTFLCIALLVSTTGVACIQGEDVMCRGLYGASAFPSVSSVVSLGWSWVMYVSSLGCQSWNTGGFSLGLNDAGAMIISSLMIVVYASIVGKLYKTCHNGGILCGNVDYVCDPLLSIVFGFLAMFMFSVGFFLKAENLGNVWNLLGTLLRIVGMVVVFIACVIQVASVPAKYNGVYMVSTVMTVLNLCFSIVCCDFKSLIRASKKKIKNTKLFNTQS